MPDYDYTFKMLLLGEGSVGKTSFTKRYVYSIFNPSEKLTIGVDFHVKTIELKDKDGEIKKVKLQIWDIGGEERFRFLLPTYTLGSNAGFLLYDITRPDTLDQITEWLSIVKSKAGNIPIMLIATKLDLADDQRQVPKEHGIQVCQKNNLAHFMEVSSKMNINVDEAFTKLAEFVLENTYNSK